MDNSGGAIAVGTHVSSGNQYYAHKMSEYWFRARYGVVREYNRHVSRSKYMPHQGEREIARRLRKERNL